MKKSVEISINIGFWVLVIFADSFNTYNKVDFSNTYLPVSYLFTGSIHVLPGIIIVYYLFYLYLTPYFLNRKKYGVLIISIIPVSILIISVYSNGYLYLMNHIPNRAIIPSFKPFYFIAIVLTLMGVGIKSFVLWQNTLKENNHLEQMHLKNKSALLLLKAQINPHFFFNTINNIDVLIDESPKIASEYLKKLSDILRYVLYETQNDFVKLATEIAQIESYIELQRIRTDNINYVRFNLTGELKEQKIAPMIFLPFIENAFKYSNKSIEDAISIHFMVSSDSVRMICKNFYEPTQFAVLKNEGLGIETIKQRLNLLYHDNYKLAIERTEPWFNVTLDIKLEGGN